MTSTQTQTLDAKTFLRLIEGGKNNLRVHEDAVNDLNVFPIPDGDTGANMSMTVEGGLGAVRADSCDTLGDAAQQLANGMLMSARGNSGVILSQLFAGFATALSGKETADIAELSEALETGVRFAYDSVNVPTEGTILTVAREAACAASHICEKETLEEFWQIYTDELQASLQRTPELLPVLKEAGVIDSGGAGLYYIADGIRRAFRGESIDVQSPEAYGQKVRVDFANFNENSIMTYGYCTELLLRLQHAKTDISAFSADELVKKLGTMGNSIVAFKNGSIVKVHIHTMTPGEILNYCQQFGEFLTVKIENMTLQHQDTLMEKAVEPDKPRDEKKKFALVTVASGAGIREAFLQLGADVVLDGRQTQNPAAADFIRAFDEANAETIFVLPNNSNIFLTAKQAGELYEDADIRVLNSRNIGEGYAALSMLSYDSGDADTVAALLSSAMQGVETGMISRAVRDSVCNGVRVKKDDFIALAEGTVLGASDDRLGAAMALLEKLQTRQHEILIAVYGADFPAEERAKFREAVASVYRNTELCELDGEQSIYDLIVIVE